MSLGEEKKPKCQLNGELMTTKPIELTGIILFNKIKRINDFFSSYFNNL